MFISTAHAQEVAETLSEGAQAVAPSMANTFAWNMGLIFILVFMFYFLLIRPQQKRLQAHNLVLDALKKGDESCNLWRANR